MCSYIPGNEKQHFLPWQFPQTRHFCYLGVTEHIINPRVTAPNTGNQHPTAKFEAPVPTKHVPPPLQSPFLPPNSPSCRSTAPGSVQALPHGAAPFQGTPARFGLPGSCSAPRAVQGLGQGKDGGRLWGDSPRFSEQRFVLGGNWRPQGQAQHQEP